MPLNTPAGAGVRRALPDAGAATWSQPSQGAGAPLLRVWECGLAVQGDRWVDDAPVAPLYLGHMGPSYATYLGATVHPDDAPRVLAEVENALRGKRELECTYRVRLNDGVERTFRDRGRVVRDAEGVALRLLGVTHDITDLPAGWDRDAQPETSPPHDPGLLQGLLVHRGGIPLHVNRRLARVLGYAGVEDLLARAPLQDLTAQVSPDGEPNEVAWALPDGGTLWVQTAADETVWDGMVATRVAVVDITARKQLEEELERVRFVGAAGALAAGLVHDFNNLLQIVTGFAGLLSQQLPSKGPVRSHLEQILRSADRGSRLVRKLLTLGQRTEVEPVPLDVNQTVESIVELVQPTFPARYHLEFRPAAALPDALGDATALEQIILNLLLNARDAMPEGGELVLETASQRLESTQAPDGQEGLYVRVTVRDAGCGMSEEMQARVFEPFVSTKPGDAGSGLGLSVVRHLVAAQGGVLTAESAVGAGTSVHVHLRMVDTAGDPVADAVHRVEDGNDTPQATTARKTLLVAERNPAVGEVIVRFLEQAGHAARWVASVRELRELLSQDREAYSLVLLGEDLEEGCAFEVLVGMRKQWPHLPVVITSGDPVEAEELSQYPGGAQQVLHKPMRVRDLLAAVEHLQQGLHAEGPRPTY